MQESACAVVYKLIRETDIQPANPALLVNFNIFYSQKDFRSKSHVLEGSLARRLWQIAALDRQFLLTKPTFLWITLRWKTWTYFFWKLPHNQWHHLNNSKIHLTLRESIYVPNWTKCEWILTNKFKPIISTYWRVACPAKKSSCSMPVSIFHSYVLILNF